MSYQQYRPHGFNLLPPVVKNLLILNVIFFLATVLLESSVGVDLASYLGLRYPGSQAFTPYQFITYMFLHGSIQHIIFNMFALWMFGYTLENIWGPKRFLTYYIFTGVGAALLHYVIFYFQFQPVVDALNEIINDVSYGKLQVFHSSVSQHIHAGMGDIYLKYLEFSNTMVSLRRNPDSVALLESARGFVIDYKQFMLSRPNVIGASGAVFGILLAFGMLFPNVRIYLYFMFPIKAKWFVIAYGAIELYFGLTQKGGNIAHFAHLGGMLFGYLLLLIWKQKRIS
jgi:membrane associated rhomboid family serine protease